MFETSLIDYYDAAITEQNKPKKILYIHDTATGHDFLKSTTTAAHLVRHSLGNDMLGVYQISFSSFFPLFFFLYFLFLFLLYEKLARLHLIHFYITQSHYAKHTT